MKMKKNTILKNSFQIVLGVFMLWIVFFGFTDIRNNEAHAQLGETPYGGQNLFQITCTCSANTLIFLQDYSSSSLLRLVYQPGVSTLYDNYNTLGTYLLGSYLEGSGICEVVSGPSCVEIASDGEMGFAPGTGTSNIWNFSRHIAQAVISYDYHIQGL